MDFVYIEHLSVSLRQRMFRSDLILEEGFSIRQVESVEKLGFGVLRKEDQFPWFEIRVLCKEDLFIPLRG